MSLSACKFVSEDTPKIIITTGFEKDELFKIEDITCTLPEMMVYLTNIQNQYETVYGKRIWQTNIDGVSLEDNIKDMALSKMAQVKAINILSRKYAVALEAKEEASIEKATDTYFSSLNETEIALMGIDRDVIYGLYREYAISEKLYQKIIEDVNPEISDDEARTITVEHILIKTYNLDEDGNRIEYTEYSKEQAYNKAKEALQRAKEGENFETLCQEYSDDDTMTYSFSKGEMDAVFENTAFNLGNDEISDIVRTEYGYHIIKCISTFDREETDANKENIVEKRREEAFSNEYNEFAETITKDINEELWEQVEFINDERVTTSDFFEIFDECWNSK